MLGWSRYAEGFFWGTAVGSAFGMLVGIAISVSQRRLCIFCGRRHPARPSEMSAMEYMKFYCGGYYPHQREESA